MSLLGEGIAIQADVLLGSADARDKIRGKRVLLGPSPVPSGRFRKDIDKAGCPHPGVALGGSRLGTTHQGLELGMKNFLGGTGPCLVLDSSDQECLRLKAVGHGKAGGTGPEAKHTVNC